MPFELWLSAAKCPTNSKAKDKEKLTIFNSGGDTGSVLHTSDHDLALAPNEVTVRAYVLEVLPAHMWPSTRYSIEVAPRCFKCHQGISQAAKDRVRFLVTFTGSIPTHAVKLCVPCAELILSEEA